MSKKALVIIANGSEEMEAVIAIDVLRRGNVEVTVAGLEGPQPVECSRQVNIVPDVSLADVDSSKVYDVMVLPGGLKGSESFAKSPLVKSLLTEQYQNGRLVAAICAAPIALKAHNIAAGHTITSYPAMKQQLQEGELYKYSEDKVVVDRNVITSRGPGTAYDFGLKLVELLQGAQAAQDIRKAMLVE
ncbi:PARK7 [Cordylochernes scorpioides]|uniref:PARK7 n=1 Tax=Cordylochernes scorpioides TaxID=51811 RepID=A0ABY6KI78_9ARAC|nr:PARK7 [Cordylochernes scorpioides]